MYKHIVLLLDQNISVCLNQFMAVDMQEKVDMLGYVIVTPLYI